MDQVKISPNADPPVCKIMDYGKYLYELSKKEKRKQRKKQTNISVKEIRLSAKIEEHDFAFKLRNAEVPPGWRIKVKASIEFRDAGNAIHLSMAYEVIDEVCPARSRNTEKWKKKETFIGRQKHVGYVCAHQGKNNKSTAVFRGRVAEADYPLQAKELKLRGEVLSCQN